MAKRVLYVGGLDESLTSDQLRQTFMTFGDIADVNMPIDNRTGKHRGFCFIEFEDADDAAAAQDNYHNTELNGKTISINLAKPSGASSKGIWEMGVQDGETEATDGNPSTEPTSATVS